ncbi:MAG: NADH-quinone oxidoreductase subunit NuoK [Anaerolineales bacterium]
MIPLSWYLLLAAALFCIGLYGVLARRNAIAILMGIELMLVAAIVNVVAFWRYGDVANITGQVFAVVIFAIAAAEAAVGLALVIAVYRHRQSVVAEEMDLLKW